MTRSEFEQKYLMDAFFWISEENHIAIQKILQEFGIKCHTGGGFIKWHKEFKNIVTFPPDKFHEFEYYQISDIWIYGARYGEPKDSKRLFEDYKKIKS